MGQTEKFQSPSKQKKIEYFIYFIPIQFIVKKIFRENVISINIFLDNVKQMIPLAMFLFAAYPEVFDR